MSSNSDDIQAAGSDTRPPMLDRTDYESWSQRIRLYCRGKENGLQILQSIDQGPFKLGTIRDTLGITPEGGVLLGPERPHTYEDLSDTEKKRYDADVRGSPFNICLKWINPKISTSTSITTLKQKHFGDQSKMLHFQVLSSQKKDRESQLYDEFRECFKMPDKNQNQNQGKMLLGDGVLQAMGGNRIEAGMPIQNVAGKQSPKKVQFLDEEELLFLASEQGNTFDADADNQPVQDLALNEDNIFQADECDAFESDVDDQPTAQTIFMANLSSAGLANPQADPSNASILSEITRAKTTDQNNSLLSEIENLKAQLKDNSKCVTIPNSKPKVLAPGRYPIDVEPIPPRLKKNREVHLHYIKHLKENVETLRKIVEEAKNASTNSLRKKRVTFVKPCETSTHNTPPQVEHHKINSTNAPGIPSKLVKGASAASRSKPRSNTKKDRTLPAKSALKQVESHSRMNKSNEKQKNRVDSSISYKRTIVLWYLDSCCSKHMTGDRSRLKNFVKKFIGTVRFKNDHFGATMGYGDYVIGDSVISRVYYVKGLGHNLFSVGKFCDSDLEVAFRKHMCFVRNLDGVDLIKGSCGTNLYTISVDDMMRSSLICLLSKASKNKSWLWHHRLNHLNFGTLNDLARKDLVRGLPWLKFEKDHLCSACQLGKSRKATHKPKTINTITEVLHTLHMDLCGPMRVQSINGKKYILVLVDDYSRFPWVKFLRSKDETPLAHSRNRTLVEAARTILIFSKAPLFLWAEAVATACYTQNRSFIHTLHDKTPYELVHDKKSDLSFFRIFGALCYPTNDSEDLGKLKAKADIGFFVGYAPNRKGYRIYNKLTRQIMETIHVTFDELTGKTALVLISSGLALQRQNDVCSHQFRPRSSTIK
ncbi:retrovirus-related pol polyprotein from transposon TNT 1-94 [Tanacetum coccineum]